MKWIMVFLNSTNTYQVDKKKSGQKICFHLGDFWLNFFLFFFEKIFFEKNIFRDRKSKKSNIFNKNCKFRKPKNTKNMKFSKKSKFSNFQNFQKYFCFFSWKILFMLLKTCSGFLPPPPSPSSSKRGDSWGEPFLVCLPTLWRWDNYDQQKWLASIAHTGLAAMESSRLPGSPMSRLATYGPIRASYCWLLLSVFSCSRSTSVFVSKRSGLHPSHTLD